MSQPVRKEVRDKLYEEYVENGLSGREIADKYGYGEQSVNDWIRKLGIKRPEVGCQFVTGEQYRLYKSLRLTSSQRELVIGTVLGDGSIEFAKGSRNPYLSLGVGLSTEAREYLEWKVDMMGKFFRRRPRREKKGWFVASVSHPEFLKLYVYLYPNGVKRITREALDQIGPFGVAVWFQDDGGSDFSRAKDKPRENCMYDISICRDEGEVSVAQNYFQEVYGISSVLQLSRSDRDYFSLYFPKENSRLLESLISPYIIPCMRYKIGQPSVSSETIRRAPSKEG